MRTFCALLIAILLTGCGHDPVGPSPTPTPSPQPQPSTITVHGTMTDTVSGAILGSFSREVTSLPALVDVSTAGHLTRRARVVSATPTVDLIQDAAPFNLTFYRELARNAKASPAALDSLRVLGASPSIYLQRTGLTDATVALMRARAIDAISAFSGGRRSLAQWETGTEVRPLQSGWIMVELVNEPDDNSCGRALVGAVAGHIWLDIGQAGCTRPIYDTFGHELGHAMGFRHVSDPAALMNDTRPRSHNGLVSDLERYHAGIAYARQSGNGDVDQDVLTSPIRSAVVISD